MSTIMLTRKFLPVIFCLFLYAGAGAQTKALDYSTIRVSDWVTQRSDTLDYVLGEYGDKPAFMLKRNIADSKSASLAYPKRLDFADGTIELDIASPFGKQGFVGVAFHIQDSNHYETVYFRPGASGTGEAVQYMPKKKAEFDWWDYEAASWQSSAVLPETNWFHVKIVIKGREMKVYLDNKPAPVMIRSDLDASLPRGSAGFWLGNSPSGAYRNLKIEKNR
jgi:hypothetical protein